MKPTPRRGPLSLVLLVLLPLSLLLTLSFSPVAPASAERLGPGRPDQPGFSGYTTRAGHEIGIAALGDGTVGICLDTGTRRWPHRAARPTTVTDPVVGYLLSTRLERARRDGVLAAALWWVVGKERALNSQPGRMRARLGEMRRESPALYRRVGAAVRALLADARRHAPPSTGYRAPRPGLGSDGRSGTVTDLGIRSAGGAWVLGATMRVTLQGARFTDGRAVRTLRTGTAPQALAWRRIGGEEVVVAVRYSDVPHHRYLLHRAGARFQRVAASAGSRTLAASARLPALPTPSITTRVNLQRASVGAVLADAVTVRGTGGSRLTGSWLLLGPVAPDASLRCRKARWAGAPVAGSGSFVVHGDSTVQVGRTRIQRGGCYTYQERLAPSPWTLGTPWTPAGLVEETSLVGPRQPVVPDHPQVATGGSRVARTTARAATAPRIVVPGTRVSATLHGTDFRRSTLTAPYQRTAAGIWRAGSTLSALVGTTVVVGHVSDNRDRPGAFHALRRVRIGQQVRTADSSGAVQRWRVVRIRALDRRKLPRSLFQQGIERRLVLITCTGRVNLPGGGFHYRKNLVVEAVPA